jgi:hypothetical protein
VVEPERALERAAHARLVVDDQDLHGAGLYVRRMWKA